ncbi:MAG: 30S ribosomal protein S12 methylthiotransferase RimO [Desulfomonilaceae bacterium]
MKNDRLFNLVSLGCPKNRVDSERILSVMTQAGFVYTDDPAAARVIIINTCAFIEPAVEESIDTILDYRDNREAFLVVAGCMPLRYRESLEEPLPEVDLFLTPDKILDLPNLLKETLNQAAESGSSHLPTSAEFLVTQAKVSSSRHCRVLTTAGYAYLKIAEGCSRLCRYCTIPSIRGPLRSADPYELEQEAIFLASVGVRELVLVAQDLTSYGVERGEKGGLIRLLERLRRVEDIKWIRLMYLYPDSVPRGLGRLINESENILPYLDIPFQHVSAEVLRAMGRPWKGDRIRKLTERLRNEIPGLVLRTTFMVGYPAEGDKEFSELRDFVQSFDIDHVGVFTYSPEEGTPAKALGDPVSADVKQARADEIRVIHSRLTEKRNRQRIDRVEQGIVEGVSEESELLLQGRLWNQAPEVDGILYVTAGEATAGEIHNIRITNSNGPDFFGEIA